MGDLSSAQKSEDRLRSVSSQNVHQTGSAWQNCFTHTELTYSLRFFGWIVWVESSSARWKSGSPVENSAWRGPWKFTYYEANVCDLSPCLRGLNWHGESKALRWNFLEIKLDFTFEEATSSPHNSQAQPQQPGRAGDVFKRVHGWQRGAFLGWSVDQTVGGKGAGEGSVPLSFTWPFL